MWKYHNTSQNTQNLEQTNYLQDLLKVLKELKTSTSAGYDNFPASLMKEGAEEIAAVFLHLINSSLRESVFQHQKNVPKLHQFINQASGHQWIITDQSQFYLSYRKYLKRFSQTDIRIFGNKQSSFTEPIWISMITFNTAHSYLFFRL